MNKKEKIRSKTEDRRSKVEDRGAGQKETEQREE